MLERAANCLKKGVFPVSRIVSVIGVWVLVLIVILTVAEVFARRAFNAPITGTLELVSLGLLLVVFLTQAHCGARNGHIALDILVVRFPKRVRAVIGALIHILTTGIFGMASWRLWAHGMKLQRMGQTSGLLQIELYPFLYIAAIGGILLTLVYLIYFLYSLDEVCK